MAIGEGQKLIEPTKELEVVTLNEEKLEKTTSIGTQMDGRTRKALVEFLKNNTDIFA